MIQIFGTTVKTSTSNGTLVTSNIAIRIRSDPNERLTVGRMLDRA